jgi:hypothetical protein
MNKTIDMSVETLIQNSTNVFDTKLKKRVDNIKLSNIHKTDFEAKYATEICNMLNIDISDLSQDEIYDLLLKSENVSKIKNKLFTQLVEMDEDVIEEWVDIINDHLEDQDEDSLKIKSSGCYNLLIDYVLNLFQNSYIFGMDMIQFMKHGTINTDSNIRDIICCDMLGGGDYI